MFLQEYFGLDGKVAIVTGGSQGIGQAIAIDLAKAGATVALFSRSGADATVKEIEAAGKVAKSYIVDVQSEEAIEKGVAEVVKDFGKVDILFNNAGITVHKNVLEAASSDWEFILKTNLLGEVAMAKAVAKVMIEKGIKGSIINMASMSGSIVNVPQMQTLYNVSKAAVIHMTKSLAIEWADYGIRVNSLSPGYIATEMALFVEEELKQEWMKLIPMHRMGNPHELSGAVIFLACDAAGYTTGTDLIVDGGYTCL